MKYSIRTILLAVAAIATLLGVFQGMWAEGLQNQQLFLGVYILLVSAIAVAAIPAHAHCRGGLFGASAFGVIFFISVLKGGFGIETMNDAVRHVKDVKIGYALIVVSFLVSQCFTTLVWPARVPEENDGPE